MMDRAPVVYRAVRPAGGVTLSSGASSPWGARGPGPGGGAPQRAGVSGVAGARTAQHDAESRVSDRY